MVVTIDFLSFYIFYATNILSQNTLMRMFERKFKPNKVEEYVSIVYNAEYGLP